MKWVILPDNQTLRNFVSDRSTSKWPVHGLNYPTGLFSQWSLLSALLWSSRMTDGDADFSYRRHAKNSFKMLKLTYCNRQSYD